MHYPTAAPDSMTIVEKIEDTLETLRPALREDGGDVELLRFDDAEGVVHLRLLGACSACPISTTTVKHGIERRLKLVIPEVREVQAV